MSARRRTEPRKSDYAWALWSPDCGVLPGTARHTRTAAICSVWNHDAWEKVRREGWRIVRVEVTALYYSSTSATMKKV